MTATMRKQRTSAEFGEAIKRVVGGEALRRIALRTGISHTYISDMTWGIIPSYPILERFCAGLELSPERTAELFGLASYAPPVDSSGLNPEAEAEADTQLSTVEYFLGRLATLQDEHPGHVVPVPRLAGGVRELTREEADDIIEELREQMAEGRYRIR